MQNQRTTNVLLSLVVLLLLALVGTQMAWWGPTAATAEETSSDSGDGASEEPTVYYSSPSLCKQWEIKLATGLGMLSKKGLEKANSLIKGKSLKLSAGWEPYGDGMARRCVK